MGKADEAVAVATGPVEVLYSSGGKGKAKNNSLFAALATRIVHELADFNPRDDLGDLTELTASVKQEGILCNLIVRPRKGGPEGHYDLVAGHRRLKVAKALGMEVVPCTIRTDLDREGDALAVALAGNDDGARTALTLIELGRAFQKLAKQEKLSRAEIAKRTGYNSKKVERALLVVDEGSDSLVKAVQSGTMSGRAAVATVSVLKDTDKKLRDSIEEAVMEQAKSDSGITEQQVKQIAKDVVKEAGAESRPGTRANRQTGSAKVAALVAWKSPKVKQDDIQKLAQVYLNPSPADSQADMAKVAGMLAYVLYDRGDIGEAMEFCVDYVLVGDKLTLPESLGDSATLAEKKAYKSQLALIRAEADKIKPEVPEAEGTVVADIPVESGKKKKGRRKAA